MSEKYVQNPVISLSDLPSQMRAHKALLDNSHSVALFDRTFH